MSKKDELRAAQREWYAKLADSGFEDIEHSEDSPFIKDHHLRVNKRVRRGWSTGGEALFQAVTEYLLVAIPSTRRERIVAMLYANGMTPQEIAQRFGMTLRAVQKQVGGLLSRVKAHIKNGSETEDDSEQAEDGSEEPG